MKKQKIVRQPTEEELRCPPPEMRFGPSPPSEKESGVTFNMPIIAKPPE